MLFEIDPRPYQAQVDQAKSQLGVIEAQLKPRLNLTYDRSLSLLAKNSDQPAGGRPEQGVCGRSLGPARGREGDAQGSYGSFEPVVHQGDRPTSTAGLAATTTRLESLVTQDRDVVLTTIVSTDPMYVYFDVEERTFQADRGRD